MIRTRRVEVTVQEYVCDFCGYSVVDEVLNLPSLEQRRQYLEQLDLWPKHPHNDKHVCSGCSQKRELWMPPPIPPAPGGIARIVMFPAWECAACKGTGKGSAPGKFCGKCCGQGKRFKGFPLPERPEQGRNGVVVGKSHVALLPSMTQPTERALVFQLYREAYFVPVEARRGIRDLVAQDPDYDEVVVFCEPTAWSPWRKVLAIKPIERRLSVADVESEYGGEAARRVEGLRGDPPCEVSLRVPMEILQ